MKKINEKELKMLFIELRHNKEKAFNNLYSKYGKLVYGIAFSILKNNADTEDVCQMIFIKIYNMENKKFPTEKEACWLYSLTKNESISYLRKKHNDINIEDIYDIEKDDQEIDYLLDKDEYNKLISRLDEKEKQVISLKILGNLSFKEISRLIDEPVSTIKWRYYKSIHDLKLLLGNLSLSIITFMIGLKCLLNNKQKNQIIENKEEIKEDAKEEQGFENSTKSEEYKENLNYADSVLENTITNETYETIKVEEKNETELNYYGIGLISTSVLFLILTLIFIIIFIKHQLKTNKKTSK